MCEYVAWAYKPLCAIWDLKGLNGIYCDKRILLHFALQGFEAHFHAVYNTYIKIYFCSWSVQVGLDLYYLSGFYETFFYGSVLVNLLILLKTLINALFVIDPTSFILNIRGLQFVSMEQCCPPQFKFQSMVVYLLCCVTFLIQFLNIICNKKKLTGILLR